MKPANSPRERSGALLLHGNEVLLIRRKNKGTEYYVVPGGGVEEGETPQEAAKRELKEEVGLEVKIGLLLYKQFDKEVNQNQYFFLAEVSDELEVVIESVKWQEEAKQSSENSYQPEWVNLDGIENIYLKPEELKPLLKRYG